MTEFLINGKKNYIPDSFSDFSRDQWIFFLKSICSYKTRSWLDVKIEFLNKYTSIPFKKLFRLYNIKSKKNLSDREEFCNHWSKVSTIIDHLSFFEKTISIENCPLPVLRCGFMGLTRLYPTNNDLSNMKTWEMAWATKYSSDFERLVSEENNSDFTNEFDVFEKHSTTLDSFIATIYRPSILFWKHRRKFGTSPFDRRRQFFDALISVYSQKISGVPLFKKLLIYWWFNSSYKNFTQNFPDIFKKPSSDSDDDFSWSDLIVSFENSIPGDEEKIGNSYAAHFLNRMVVHNKKIEALKEKTQK